MEIIAGVKRRRPWRCNEKLWIMAEVERFGASFTDVACRHKAWRPQVRTEGWGKPGETWYKIGGNQLKPDPQSMKNTSPL